MSIYYENPLALISALLAATLLFSVTRKDSEITETRYALLSVSIISLLIGVTSCLLFDKSETGFQFLTPVHFVPEYNLSFTLGADGLSMVFLLLTLFIFPILFMSA